MLHESGTPMEPGAKSCGWLVGLVTLLGSEKHYTGWICHITMAVKSILWSLDKMKWSQEKATQVVNYFVYTVHVHTCASSAEKLHPNH